MNNSTVIAESTWTANVIEFRISPSSVTTTTTPGTESVKNQGQYVEVQGGGKITAQACAGSRLTPRRAVTTLTTRTGWLRLAPNTTARPRAPPFADIHRVGITLANPGALPRGTEFPAGFPVGARSGGRRSLVADDGVA